MSKCVRYSDWNHVYRWPACDGISMTVLSVSCSEANDDDDMMIFNLFKNTSYRDK